MTVEHHNLSNEFPEYKDKIHELKMTNLHFQKLLKEHHELDKAIRQSETETIALCDENIEDFKKKRLTLKDELYSMLTKEN
jgi:uncharacterized protein